MLQYVRGSIWLWVTTSSVACSNQALAQPLAGEKLALERAIWTKISAPAVATARAANVFVYDDARHSCVVFGGRPVDDHGRSLEDTGIWSGDTWIPVAAEYGHRGYVRGAFDSLRQRTVVYGGTDGLSFFADTWEFDGSGWTRRALGSPSGRGGNGLAYDSLRQVTVLFGGYTGSSWKEELWEWDGSAWAQGCTAEPCTRAPRPEARAGAVFVYDDTRHVSLLFGGSRDGQTYDDTWSWDGVRWRELHPPHAPTARAHAAATYDPIGKRVLLFGGLAAGSQELNDFWAWDGQDWSHIAQTTLPFARHGAGMAWHAQDRRGVLFGGSAGGKQTDAWAFQLLGTPCTTSEDCHVGTCVQGSCLNDPSLPPSSGGGGNPSTGSSGGGASDGGAGGSVSLDGGSGGRPTTAGAGPVNDPGSAPAPSGGTTPDWGGVGVVIPSSSVEGEDAAPPQSFYSCALTAPSSTRRAPLRFALVLTGVATWLSRRRARSRPLIR